MMNVQQNMAEGLGRILSARGRSFCTYILKLSDTPAFEPERLNGCLVCLTGGRSEVFFAADGQDQLVVRIDHELVDAQRGVAMLLRALSECKEATPVTLTSPSPCETFWTLSVPASDAATAAKKEGITVTQWALKRLWPDVSLFSEIRLIVSKASDVAAEVQATGNHFVPVDITSQALAAMLEKPAPVWKKLLTRLTSTAERLMNAETRVRPGRECFRDTLTVTSVGSLEGLKPVFSEYGIGGMTMYPENVSFCSSVVTIYSLFDRLHFVFSGQQPLDESVRTQFDDFR